MGSEEKRIVVLGGGFGGVYTAMYLEKWQRRSKVPFAIYLVNKENYFVFQPMLAEVIGGSLGLLDTISPLRKLLPKTNLYIREVEAIDLAGRKLVLAPQYSHKTVELRYDQLVLALGNVTDFRGLAGLYEHALPFKNLADTLTIRNQLIEVVQEAAYEHDPQLKRQLLTFVVAGGGFSGTEMTAELNDFVRKLAKGYPTIQPEEIRVCLVHSKQKLMEHELSESLSSYAAHLLQKRGVELLFGRRLAAATPEEALLDDGQRILTRTIISTVPSAPHPLIADSGLPLDKGKVVADGTLQVKGYDELWAVGDCAAIPNMADGKRSPPTAQFAIRQAKLLASNLVAQLHQQEKKQFHFKPLGMMGALGHHSAVAELRYCFRFSGLLAWFLWRSVYWWKLPGFGRKVKVGLTWLLDMLIPIEAVQIKAVASQGVGQLHFEAGEVIFHQGDQAEHLYIIVSGEVEISVGEPGREQPIAKLTKGQYFGETALLHEIHRLVTARCLTPVDLLALKKKDFRLLIANLQGLRDEMEKTEEMRRKAMKALQELEPASGRKADGG